MCFNSIVLAGSLFAQFVGVFERPADPSPARILGDEHATHRLIVVEAYGPLFATEIFGDDRSCYVAVRGGFPKDVDFVKGPPTLYLGNPTDLEIRQRGDNFHEINVQYHHGDLSQMIFYDQRIGNTIASSVAFLEWQRQKTKPDVREMYEVGMNGDRRTCLPSSVLPRMAIPSIHV